MATKRKPTLKSGDTRAVLSPRNLKCLRALAAARTDRSIVQEVLAQITWFHNCILLDRVTEQVRALDTTTEEPGGLRGWTLMNS